MTAYDVGAPLNCKFEVSTVLLGCDGYVTEHEIYDVQKDHGFFYFHRQVIPDPEDEGIRTY
jgi:hypothetical protein